MGRQSAVFFVSLSSFIDILHSHAFNPRPSDSAFIVEKRRGIPNQALAPIAQSSRIEHWRLHSNDNSDNDTINKGDSDVPVILRGFDEDEISDEVWENIETGEPPKWLVMKEILGINIFTYLLAALIVLFLAANLVLGPGWLGQAIGMQGTGTFTDVSPSLPDTVDLNDPKFLL